ncbi:MAG: PAS domain S-box protein [Desulfomonilaceae bacterium]
MEDLHNKESRSLYWAILTFVCLVAGIVIIGYQFYRHYEINFRVGVENQLASVADMKVSGLVQWKKERLGDMFVFYRNTSFFDLVRHYLEHPDDIESQKQLSTWIGAITKYYEYDEVFLVDVNGAKRLSAPESPEPVCPFVTQHVLEAIRSRQLRLTDFYRDDSNKSIYLALIVPILNGHDSNRTIGALVIRIDPQRYLYPFIQQWPTPSQTGETLLIRRDGADVQYLNELKFRKDTALERRISLAKPEYPAVKAILGQKGVVDGIDYRGEKVIAYVRSIPDFPWFMIARMDSAEIYAPLREQKWLVVFLVGSLLVGSGASLGWIWKQHSARFYKEKCEAAEALQLSEERFQRLFEQSPSGIAVVGLDYRWLSVNATLCEIVGYTEDELTKLTFVDITHPDDIDKGIDYAEKLKRDDISSCKLEKRYIKKNGEEIWVNLTTSIIHNKLGKQLYLLCIFEDISERKRGEELLHTIVQRYHTILSNMYAGVLVASERG